MRAAFDLDLAAEHRRCRRGWALGLVLTAALLAVHGCGSGDELLPAIDPLSLLPDNSQTTVLPSGVVFPDAGPVGTEITVHGQGRVFPAGFVKFTFQGTAVAETVLEQPSNAVKVRVPEGAVSGPFGFTIAARPTFNPSIQTASTGFEAYTVPDPGFTVTAPPPPAPSRIGLR